MKLIKRVPLAISILPVMAILTSRTLNNEQNNKYYNDKKLAEEGDKYTFKN